MKVAFVSPYIPKHKGGGEKHLLAMATQLAALGASVTIAVSNARGSVEEWKVQYEQFFGLHLSTIHFEVIPPLTGTSIESIMWQRRFDYIYLVSDGSFFFPWSKRSVLHVQVPFTTPLSHWGKIKLRQWTVLQTNSQFTAHSIEQAWGRQVDQIINPVVDDDCFTQSSKRKGKYIVSVGRFFTQLHSKRQDVLIKAIAQLLESHPDATRGWQLVLIGSIEDQNYFNECQALAKDLPIQFVTAASRAELLAWYGRASMYWHAAGFEVDEEKHPEKVEHFGISTAEAMAAGSIPLVVPKGGQKEVIGKALLPFSWQTEKELVAQTYSLILDSRLREQLSATAVRNAHAFDSEHFTLAVRQLFSL